MLAKIANLRTYSVQTNQSQSLNASQHPAIILLRVEPSVFVAILIFLTANINTYTDRIFQEKLP